MINSSQKLTEVQGGGVASFFGLFFLLPGLFVMSVPFTSGEWATAIFTTPFGAIFAGVGLFLTLGRWGWTVDRNTRTITTWWGLLRPLKRTAHSWDDYEEVRVYRDVRGSGKNRRTVYPVTLTGRGEAIEFSAPSTHAQARAMGERVAKFMHFGLRDEGSGTVVVREAGTLDESLHQRYKRIGQKFDMPEPVVNARARLSVEDAALVFDIPGPGLNFATGLSAFLSLGFCTFIFIGFVVPVTTSLATSAAGVERSGVLSLLWGTYLLVMAVGAGRLYRDAHTSKRLVISAESLRLESRGEVDKIPSAELEEVEMSGHPTSLVSLFGSGQVEARSDSTSLQFGAGLPAEELKWIRDSIHFFMASMR